MSASLWMSATCRVCLASDREMYRLANTALEETYERVTSGTLVVEGRPCCVCGVCLSALRRCRRFIDTAREANDALDRWIRNHPNTDTLKLTERPLFYLTQRTTEVIEITNYSIGKSEIKQESDTAENEDDKIIYGQYPSDDESNILTEEIKFEVTSDDGNDYTYADTSEEKHDVDMSDDKADEAQMSDNIEGHSSVQEGMIYVEDMQTLNNVKPDISDVVGETAPDAFNVANHPPTSSKDIEKPLLVPRSRKRVKPKEDTKSGPACKKRRPITSKRRRGNTDLATAQHNEGDISCIQCNYKTNNNQLLKAHTKTHKNEKRFMCDKCDYKSNRNSQLQQHLLIHSDERQFSCDKCDYKCKLKGYLRQHLWTHNAEKTYLCDKCDHKFIAEWQLKRHLLTHTEEKPFPCDKCDAKFKRRDYLKRHLMMHTGEKPFACDKCDYRCSEKKTLKHHALSHSVDKLLTCDFCNYKTIHDCHLKQHLLTHTGNMRFACDKCDYRSNYKSHLKRHLMRHTGAKPFACDKCDYKSNRKEYLKMHLKTHIGEQPFVCDKCDYKFSNKKSLDKHRKQSC